MTICERTGVWAALSERSYGGIGFDSDGILSGLIKAKADVRSTKNTHKGKVYGEKILTNSTFIGLHNFNPLNCGFYIEYQRNKEQYKREDIAS